MHIPRRRSPKYPEVLVTLGKWSSDLKCESTNTILEDYMERAITCYERSSQRATDKTVDAYVALAVFADAQYKQICEYMKSKDYEDKRLLLEKLEVEAKNMQGMHMDKEMRTGMIIKERNVKMDAAFGKLA